MNTDAVRAAESCDMDEKLTEFIDQVCLISVEGCVVISMVKLMIASQLVRSKKSTSLSQTGAS